jgi:hypothetical protein
VWIHCDDEQGQTDALDAVIWEISEDSQVE